MPEIRRWLRLTDHSQLMNYKTPIVINHLGTIKNFIRYFILHNYILQLMIIWICLCYSSIIVLWPWVIKMCCWNSSSGTTSSSAVRYISYLTTHVMRGGGALSKIHEIILQCIMQNTRNFWHSLQGKQQMTDYSHSEYSLHYSSDYSLEIFRYN